MLHGPCGLQALLWALGLTACAAHGGKHMHQAMPRTCCWHAQPLLRVRTRLGSNSSSEPMPTPSHSPPPLPPLGSNYELSCAIGEKQQQLTDAADELQRIMDELKALESQAAAGKGRSEAGEGASVQDLE